MAACTTNLIAFDTHVRPRPPVWAGVWCTLSIGVSGAVRHARVNAELQRFGRARGAMPFPFFECSPGAAVTTWVGGVLAWMIVVASLGTYVASLWSGARTPTTDDVSSIAALALLLSPLWLTALHTTRRIRRAQFLVGVDRVTARPWLGASLSVIAPPLGTWYTQREVDRAWEVWRAASTSIPTTPPTGPAIEVGR